MDPPTRVFELVERLGNLLREEARTGALRGLAPVHWQTLDYLARCNRFSDHPGAVTEYLGLTKGTVSQTLKLLETRGLLERIPDERDGRRVRLRLTPAGRRRVERGIPPGSAARALDGMGGGGAELEKLLDELLRRWVRARGGRLFGACHTCRHLRGGADGYRCGLLDEPLTEDDTRRICREQEPFEPEVAPTASPGGPAGAPGAGPDRPSLDTSTADP